MRPLPAPAPAPPPNAHERAPACAGLAPAGAAGRRLNRARLNRALVDAPTASHVFCLWEAHAASFNHINLSTALLALARCARAAPDERARAGGRAGGGGGKGALVADGRFVALVREVGRQLDARPASFDGRSLAALAHAGAKVGAAAPPCRELLARVARAAEPRVAELELRHLAQLAHAYALAGVPAPRLFAAIARAGGAALCAAEPPAARREEMGGTSGRLDGGSTGGGGGGGARDAQALANLGWAFARAAVPAPALFAALDAAAARRVREFGGAELGMLLWAHAMAGAQPVALLRALEAALDGDGAHVGEGAPLHAEQLAMMAWAAVSLGHTPRALLLAAARAAASAPAVLDDGRLTSLAWALAKAPDAHESGELAEAFDALAAAALPRVPALRPAELASLCAALGAAARGARRAGPRAAGTSAAAGAAVARRRGLHAALLGATERAALRAAVRLRPPELAAVTASIAACGSRDGALFTALSDAAAARVDELAPRHVVAICRALARAHAAGVRGPGGGCCGAALFGATADWGAARLRSFGGAELAELCWARALVAERPARAAAVARHGARDALAPRSAVDGRALSRELRAACGEQLGAVDGARLAALAVACARSAGGEAEDAPLFAAVAHAATARASDLRDADLGALAWAVGRARLGSDALWTALAAEAEARAPALPLSIAAVLACALASAHAARAAAPRAERGGGAHGGRAEAQPPPAALLHALHALCARGAHAAGADAGSLDAAGLDVAGFAWALATVRSPASPPLLARLAPAAARHVHELAAQPRAREPAPGDCGARGARVVSALAWAYARGEAGARPADALAGDGEAADARAPPDARAEPPPQPQQAQRAGTRAVLVAAAAWGEAHADELGARQLALLAEAFPRARARAPCLFAALAPRAAALAPTMAPRELAACAWAFAAARGAEPAVGCDDGLFGALEAAAGARAADFTPAQLARFAWAVAVRARGGAPAPWGDAQRALWSRVAAVAHDDWSERERRALGQAAHSARAGASSNAHVAAALERLVRDVPPAAAARACAPSRYTQLVLSRELRARGWAHEDEVAVAGGLLLVDMADERARVALEFDGPSHFLADVRTGELSEDGRSAWKGGALAALGWRVVRVSFGEWREAECTPERRDAFLGALVARLTAPPGPVLRPAI
ncbi:hypothetical protein KFE25_008461 [Diacronema lutheri]|uniref:RAP domain-containing protein n=1 Tax=Diacronema lutheri TaxID=2081491 RepID=A0A8J6C2Q3_DIALT|nr:hypothetical protein KFE25_008461 [Diacronema lutheri]